MEEKKNKTKTRFIFLFKCILLFFAFVYLMGMTGYYETHLQKNTILTQEAILEFEKDVAEGLPVDLKDYIRKVEVDYSNKYSRFGDNLSKSINTILTEGVKYFSDFFKTLFS